MNTTHPSNSVTHENLDEIFTYHDDPDKLPLYWAVREAGKNLVSSILNSTPPCADQSAAIRKVREAVTTANEAIALAPPHKEWPNQFPPGYGR